MTDFYFDGDLVGADPGDGSSGNPWKLLSHLRAQTGDNHTFTLVGDFRDQTAGTNGHIEAGGNGWTVTGTLRSGSKPKIGSTPQAAVNISSVSISSTTVTLDTSSAHGLVVDDTVTVANVTGAATAANGTWQVVTQPSSTRITFTLGTASSGTSTNGTVQRVIDSKGAVYNSGKTGLTINGLLFSRVRYGVRTAGTGVTGQLIQNCDGEYLGKYMVSGSGSSSGMICEYCTVNGTREDAFNFSGSSNTDFIIRYCTGIYIGYNPDLSTPSLDLGTGPGDFVTTHPGSGASNYGTVHHCSASYGTQGFFTCTNVAGTCVAYDNFVSEFAGSGFSQTGGGSMAAWNNVYIAPVNQALDNTTSRGMFKFNPGSGVGGTYLAFQNTGYTAKGSIASFATAAAMFVVSGGIINGAFDQFILKNNRWLSNGTAPFAQVVNHNNISITNLVCAAGVATATAASHGLTAGCRVRIIGVTGGAAAVNNTTQTVASVIDANNYTFATGVSGTSTNGSSQRVPMLVSDYNTFSGVGTETLFSYGATSASYTGNAWKTHYDSHSAFGASIRTVPPTLVDSFRKPSGGLKAGDDLSDEAASLSYPGLLSDYDGRPRTTTPDTGAFQLYNGGGAFGSLGGILSCPGYFTF